MVSLVLVIVLSAVSCWLALSMAGRWENRRRVLERLGQDAAARDGVPKNKSQALLLSVFSSKLASSSLVHDDYRQVSESLKLTGSTAEAIQVAYVLGCWLLPLFLWLTGALLMGFWMGLLLAAASFAGSRRFIRSLGVSARHRQNQQSIELAQMMAMLLESGVSIERAFRITALQARPLIPDLAYRLDRFNRLMDSGASRSAAFDDISGGKDIPVLYSLIRLLKQAGALGGSIGDSLEQLVLEAQEIERSRIKEQVNKVGAKMTVVMMLFMLPALFILIGGPAALNIVQALSR